MGIVTIVLENVSYNGLSNGLDLCLASTADEFDSHTVHFIPTLQ